MAEYRFVIRSCTPNDPRSTGLLTDAHALGFHDLKHITCQDLYFIEGQLSPRECEQLALRLLTDPITQTADWSELPAGSEIVAPADAVVEVALRHGVTDSVASEIVRAAHELGFAGVHRAATGLRFLVNDLEVKEVEQLARRLLTNVVIHYWKIGEIIPSFPEEVGSTGRVEMIHLQGCNDDELLAISKERLAALNLEEMRVIRACCVRERRDLTDVEFESIAQTWSEHCVHKTFKARISIEQPDQGDRKDIHLRTIDSLLNTYLRSATEQINAAWVISAFVDNAGIVDLGDGENEVSFKVETHNHPSAIEPFGGANTGVGGVVRDVLGVSHRPIANTDVLCFGLQNTRLEDLPEGVLHPRRILSGVVAGIQDYGNKMGIPTVGGAILFDPAYSANPLVFCGTIGTAPKNSHVRSPQPGDRVIILGGRTGRDGLRGATFSSMTMDAQTGTVSGSSVQIGNPIVEKGLVDVILPARDLRLYHAITDCGAGGLSSAVGEMSSSTGAEVDLVNVRLKYSGLDPWEIWLSEAQERMVLAIPPANLARLQELCNTYNVEITDIGEFNASGRLVVRFGGKIVLDLDNNFLHHGMPQQQLRAVVSHPFRPASTSKRKGKPEMPHAETLLRLLAHPNIASKSCAIRVYDHEVQGGTVIKPLTGVHADAPSDAAVLKPLFSRGRNGIVISHGINPEYGKHNPYHMALAVIDEAIRNAVAVGANPDRIALLDNFCWGDPRRPDTLGSLVEAARGCHDGAVLFNTPFISGKDSLNNEYLGTDGQRHAIPPTLLISALGVISDIENTISMDLKAANNFIYLVGDFRPVFGGSHLTLVSNGPQMDAAEPVPSVSEAAPRTYRALYQAVQGKCVCACHDLSEGGLAIASAEMCIGGRLGLLLELEVNEPVRALFGETTGCLLVEVSPDNANRFESYFINLPVLKIGTVSKDDFLCVSIRKQSTLKIPVPALVDAWNTPLQ